MESVPSSISLILFRDEYSGLLTRLSLSLSPPPSVPYSLWFSSLSHTHSLSQHSISDEPDRICISNTFLFTTDHNLNMGVFSKLYSLLFSFDYVGFEVYGRYFLIATRPCVTFSVRYIFNSLNFYRTIEMRRDIKIKASYFVSYSETGRYWKGRVNDLVLLLLNISYFLTLLSLSF